MSCSLWCLCGVCMLSDHEEVTEFPWCVVLPFPSVFETVASPFLATRQAVWPIASKNLPIFASFFQFMHYLILTQKAGFSSGFRCPNLFPHSWKAAVQKSRISSSSTFPRLLISDMKSLKRWNPELGCDFVVENKSTWSWPWVTSEEPQQRRERENKEDTPHSAVVHRPQQTLTTTLSVRECHSRNLESGRNTYSRKDSVLQCSVVGFQHIENQVLPKSKVLDVLQSPD